MNVGKIRCVFEKHILFNNSLRTLRQHVQKAHSLQKLNARATDNTSEQNILCRNSLWENYKKRPESTFCSEIQFGWIRKHVQKARSLHELASAVAENTSMKYVIFRNERWKDQRARAKDTFSLEPNFGRIRHTCKKHVLINISLWK